MRHVTLVIWQKMYAGDFVLQRDMCQVSEAPPLSGSLALPRALSDPPCTPGPPPHTFITQHSLHCLQALHSICTDLKFALLITSYMLHVAVTCYMLHVTVTF